MGVKENKELIRRLYEEGFKGDPERLDRYFAATYRDHAFWGDLGGLKESLKAARAAFPSLEWKVEDLVGEGEKVAVRFVVLVGSMGEVRRLGGTSIFRLENGRIAETWGNGDPLY